MVIRAKFNSRCPKCGNFINAGDEVNWERGSKATHVTCPEGKPAQATGGPRKTGQLWEECPRCGREPVYMPLHLCEHCWPKMAKHERIDTTCREPYRRGIGQGFGSGEDADV